MLQSDTGALSIALPTQSGPHAITWYTSNFATVPTGFSVIGTGDFNGDGVTDLMIQNKTTGQVEVGLVSAGDIAKWTPVGTISNSAGWNLSA